MQINRFVKKGQGISALGFLIAAALFNGCEGPQGPPGEGVGELDTRPPSISWVTPTRSDTIYTPTFDVRVNASDNRGVLFVQFFLDGVGSVNGTAAVDSSAPYTYSWDLTAVERGYGVYPIIARAFDTSLNNTDTPPLLVTYAPLPETQLLSYFGDGEFDAMHLPDRYTDKYFNVRFTPYAACTVREVHFFFEEPTEWTTYAPGPQPLVGGCDMNLFLWRSGSGGLPAIASGDSMLVLESALTYGDWTILDVSSMDSIYYEGEFHAGFSPPSDSYANLHAQRRALPLRIQIDPSPLANPADHRSSELEQGSTARGWGTVQSHWDNEKRDFLIRVLVAYDNGVTALLTPERTELAREIRP